MGTQTLTSLTVGSRGHSVAGRGHRCLGHPEGPFEMSVLFLGASFKPFASHSLGVQLHPLFLGGQGCPGFHLLQLLPGTDKWRGQSQPCSQAAETLREEVTATMDVTVA